MFKNSGVEIRQDGSRFDAVLTRDVLNLGSEFKADDEIRLSLDTRVVPALGISGTGKLTEARLRVESASGSSWEQSDWGRGVCMKGALIVQLNPESSGVGGAPGMIVSRGDATHLLAGQDGSLLAMRQAVNAGVAVIVPWYSRKASYHHFQRADPSR